MLIIHSPRTVISIFIATLALYIGGLRAGRFLHAQLLNNVMRLPMNTFFDVTPSGRILNRFSHDMDEVDNEFPSLIRGLTSCFFSVIVVVVGCGCALYSPISSSFVLLWSWLLILFFTFYILNCI